MRTLQINNDSPALFFSYDKITQSIDLRLENPCNREPLPYEKKAIETLMSEIEPELQQFQYQIVNAKLFKQISQMILMEINIVEANTGIKIDFINLT